jgi:DNA-binding NarL/FixJ family response regulator
VSKQRPSTRRRRPQARIGPPSLTADSVTLWQARVFRNTYTRKGRTLRVKKWSVKIQHEGKRRTFSLAAASKVEAAREAHSIYQVVRAGGWEAAARAPRHATSTLTRRALIPHRNELLKSDVRYWRERLIHSKYTEARLTRLKEFSVRIEDEGVYQYFPLETDDAECAAARALRIYQTIKAKGWEAAFEEFPREITVAIFWSTSPVACTYTTLYTLRDAHPSSPPAVPGGSPAEKRILIVEPDAGVRRTLVLWLCRQPGFRCMSAVKTAEEAQNAILREPPDMLLVNRALPEMPVAEFRERLKVRLPDLPAFTHGIYQDSDQIFITLSGVTAGYIFRRRKPTELFEPIRGAIRHRTLSAKELRLQIRDYFQSLFGFTLDGDATPLASLTAREQEILSCVSKGFLDKEIAGALGISIWTVHNHLKHIYEKLNVHTRTEAVLKYLQK